MFREIIGLRYRAPFRGVLRRLEIMCTRACVQYSLDRYILMYAVQRTAVLGSGAMKFVYQRSGHVHRPEIHVEGSESNRALAGPRKTLPNNGCLRRTRLSFSVAQHHVPRFSGEAAAPSTRLVRVYRNRFSRSLGTPCRDCADGDATADPGDSEPSARCARRIDYSTVATGCR